MASRAEHYEANAQLCERQAQLVKAPEARETYLELAKTWREMARSIDLAKRHGFTLDQND